MKALKLTAAALSTILIILLAGCAGSEGNELIELLEEHDYSREMNARNNSVAAPIIETTADHDNYSDVDYDFGGTISMGNTSGNIVNKGLAAFDGEWIYYSDPADGYRLRKMSIDGSVNQLLSNEQAININVLDGIVYFTCVSFNKYAYRIFPDGTGEDDFPGNDANFLTVADDGWFYYSRYHGIYARNITNYRNNMEPGEFYINRMIWDWGDEISLADGKIFYINKEKDALYSMARDGKNVSLTADERCAYINAVDGYVYYSSTDEGLKLCKISYDGTGKTVLLDYRTEYINVSDGFIYYSSYAPGENGSLWRMRTDGTEKTKISNDRCRFINVIGNVVFYSNMNDSDSLYMISTNGEGRKRVNGRTIPEPGKEPFVYNQTAEQITTTGNIANNGLAAFDGEWIYYAGDNSQLYKRRADGSEETLLNNEESLQINLHGEWIYYANSDGIYRIRTDGAERTKLSSVYARNITITADGIYYIDNADWHSLYRINHDGTGKVKISDGIAEMSVYDNTIYFRYYDLEKDNYYYSGAIGKMNLDGSGKTKVADVAAEKFHVSGDYIYFVEEIGSGMAKRSVYRMNLDGTDIKEIFNTGNNWAMFIDINAADDGWLYYSGIELNGVFGIGTSCPLYKIRPDGTGKVLLDDEYMQYYNINKAGDWLVCTASRWEGDDVVAYIIMVRTDGAEKIVLGSR
ncbi:MAG: DUF5050 domain-containing protein [Oscillospiraceae bacterium]|nr:DUF5050 domain-containing protein [Oscillospiraceae bacterium]